jgi:KDO2-lipid IV(A) lauroyltransferase
MKIPLPLSFRKFRQKISFSILRAFLWGMGVLPRWCVNFFSELLFNVIYLALDRQKDICSRNLQSIYGGIYDKHGYQSMTKACLKNISQGMLDLLYFVNRPQELMRVVHVNHEEYLKAALEKGHGVIVVSAHLGNVPLLFIALSQKGYKVNVIIRPMRDKDFGQFMQELCARRGINMIETVPLKSFIKKSLQSLHRNELLFILLDEFVEDEFAVKVKFFNRQVNRAVGPVLFHERTGAPVLPIFIAGDLKNNLQIFIHKETEIEQGQSLEESTVRNISNLTRLIEDYVSRFPLQWGGWLSKRWGQD